MSKPNLLAFSSSVGIYRNKRVMDLERRLSKSLPGKVDRSSMAPMFFQVAMSYAAENQIDGNFEGYSPDDWSKIFVTNNVPVSPREASTIIKEFHEVGLFEKDKIRSWMKYNRHLADYEGLVRAKRKAAKIKHQKWQQEAQLAVKNGHTDAPIPEKIPSKPAQKSTQKEASSKDLWAVNEGLKTARGNSRRELLAKREQLIGEITGVDLSIPAPSPAPSAPAAPKKSEKQRQAEWNRGQVKAAKELIESGASEILTESMVLALVQDGYQLPADVESRFRKVLKAHNPVPE